MPCKHAVASQEQWHCRMVLVDWLLLSHGHVVADTLMWLTMHVPGVPPY